MMEEDQEQGFLCRFCNKSFLTGRSLGGHMRCHLALISAEKSEENDNGDVGFERIVSVSSEMNFEDVGEAGYGLRENPKKSWRVSDHKHGVFRKLLLCEKCGKGFSRLRALTVHMKSHKAKGSEEIAVCKECGKGFESVRAMYGHMRHHSKRSRVSSDKDLEMTFPIRKKRSRARYNQINSNYSCSNKNSCSSVTVTENDEAIEGAMCLMMLSKGVGSWDEFNLIKNCSKNNGSVNLEDDQLLLKSKGNAGKVDELNFVSDVGEIRKMKKPRKSLNSCGSWSNFGNLNSGVASHDEPKGELEVSVDENLGCEKFKKVFNPTELEFQKESATEFGFDQDLGLNGNSGDYHKLKKDTYTADSELLKDFRWKQVYKCKTCGKAFPTHQGLGGHRSTKTVGSCITPKVKSGGYFEADSELGMMTCSENFLEQDNVGVEVASYDLKKSKEWVCPICFKVFASGQALGGHKRAHYIGLTETRGKEVVLMGQELPDRIDSILDLNFQVATEEEAGVDVGLRPWWAGQDCEPLAILN